QALVILELRVCHGRAQQLREDGDLRVRAPDAADIQRKAGRVSKAVNVPPREPAVASAKHQAGELAPGLIRSPLKSMDIDDGSLVPLLSLEGNEYWRRRGHGEGLNPGRSPGV